MNPEPENVDQLLKLLALKRHEQPPPGYFDRFSGQVMARISVVQSRGDGFVWVRKVLAIFEARPVLTGALGAGACALVIAGIVFSDDVPAISGSGIADSARQPANLPIGASTQPVAYTLQTDASLLTSGTNPISPELANFINGTPAFSPAKASLLVPGKN